jgi:hypothetical protein
MEEKNLSQNKIFLESHPSAKVFERKYKKDIFEGRLEKGRGGDAIRAMLTSPINHSYDGIVKGGIDPREVQFGAKVYVPPEEQPPEHTPLYRGKHGGRFYLENEKGTLRSESGGISQMSLANRISKYVQKEYNNLGAKKLQEPAPEEPKLEVDEQGWPKHPMFDMPKQLQESEKVTDWSMDAKPNLPMNQGNLIVKDTPKRFKPDYKPRTFETSNRGEIKPRMDMTPQKYPSSPRKIGDKFSTMKMEKQNNPYAIATAQAKKQGYSNFKEGSPGEKKVDEISESIKKTDFTKPPITEKYQNPIMPEGKESVAARDRYKLSSSLANPAYSTGSKSRDLLDPEQTKYTSTKVALAIKSYLQKQNMPSFNPTSNPMTGVGNKIKAQGIKNKLLEGTSPSETRSLPVSTREASFKAPKSNIGSSSSRSMEAPKIQSPAMHSRGPRNIPFAQFSLADRINKYIQKQEK